MKMEDNQKELVEVTEIIELACGQLEMLTRSFDCIAQIAASGELQLIAPEETATELIN